MQRIMKYFYFLLVILLPYQSNAQTTNDTYPYINELEEYMNRVFDEYVIIQKSDYGEDTLSFFQPTTQVVGDFDGNKLLDVCLIIKFPKKGISVIAFHKTKTGFNHYVLEEREGPEYVKETLGKEGPNSVVISMADEPEKMKNIANIAIVVEWIETCYDNLYVWEKNHYVSYYRGV